MGRFVSRIEKLEQALGAPGCICDGREQNFVVIDEISDRYSREALLAKEAACHWDCPAHGAMSVALLIYLRLSTSKRSSRPPPRPPGYA